MKKTVFLDAAWFQKHAGQIEDKSRYRYTPKLNVNLPIGEIFDGLCRTRAFYDTIRKTFGKLIKEFGRVPNKYEITSLETAYSDYAQKTKALINLISEIKEYSKKEIPWNSIADQVNICQTASWAFTRQLQDEGWKIKEQREKDNPNNHYTDSNVFDSNIHHIYQVEKELRFLDEFAAGTSCKTSNNPFLLLLGQAGTGKTHLFCDIASHRLANSQPTIILFGENFDPKKGLWENLHDQLEINNVTTQQQFFETLNSKGKEASTRSLILIDALNETRNLDYWGKNIKKLKSILNKYQHISIAVSIRKGFENLVIPLEQQKLCVITEHHGFKFNEWEAVTKFFNEFGLPLPEIPLLTPEFQNPLFLLLFCKAFEERNRTLPKKQIFKGHEGATFIFENFVDKISKKIEEQFNINRHKTSIWEAIIKPAAQFMVSNSTDRISENELNSIISHSQIQVPAEDLILQLEKNLLLVKVPNYASESTTNLTFEFRFPFQKFSDHLIARYLFNQ